MTLLWGFTQAADNQTPDKTNQQILQEAALEGAYSTLKSFVIMGILSHFALANQYQAGMPGVAALAVIEGLKTGRDEYYEKIAAQKDVDREEVMPKNWVTFLLKASTLMTRVYFVAALAKTFTDSISKKNAEFNAQIERERLKEEQRQQEQEERQEEYKKRLKKLKSLLNPEDDDIIPPADRKSLFRDPIMVKALDIRSIFKKPAIGIYDYYPYVCSYQALKNSFFVASKKFIG